MALFREKADIHWGITHSTHPQHGFIFIPVRSFFFTSLLLSSQNQPPCETVVHSYQAKEFLLAAKSRNGRKLI